MNSAGSSNSTPSQELPQPSGVMDFDDLPIMRKKPELPLPSGDIDFDDLPVMRKRPRKKTKDAAAPEAAADGQPGGDTPHC